MVTGIGAGRGDGGAHDVAQERAVHRERGAAALAGDLGDRAAEVHVDVVDADLVDQVAHGLAERVRVRAVELHRPRGLGAVEAEHRRACGRCAPRAPAP